MVSLKKLSQFLGGIILTNLLWEIIFLKLEYLSHSAISPIIDQKNLMLMTINVAYWLVLAEIYYFVIRKIVSRNEIRIRCNDENRYRLLVIKDSLLFSIIELLCGMGMTIRIHKGNFLMRGIVLGIGVLFLTFLVVYFIKRKITEV